MATVDLNKELFEKYTNDVVRLTYCTSSGLIAGDGCSSTASGWYKSSNIPAKCKNCSGGKNEDEEASTGSQDEPSSAPEQSTAPNTQTNPGTNVTLPQPPVVVPVVPTV